MLVVDASLQENAIADRSKLRIPKLTLSTPPAGDAGAVSKRQRCSWPQRVRSSSPAASPATRKACGCWWSGGDAPGPGAGRRARHP